jgi:predicted deacylase
MPLPAGVSFISPTIPVYVFDAKEPGPTALIQAGIHGNEVAGTHALQELLEEGLTPSRGRLIIIPVMNPAAYRARQRMAPGGLDLNRCFPGTADAPEVENRLAARFMALVEDERPALIATLHESLKRFHPQVPQSFGQTLVYGVQPMPSIITRVVERMNQSLQHPYELWAPHHYPVATSSTEVIVDKLGCIGICVETWEVFEERRRIDMQRDVVRLLLEEIGVLG